MYIASLSDSEDKGRNQESPKQFAQVELQEDLLDDVLIGTFERQVTAPDVLAEGSSIATSAAQADSHIQTGPQRNVVFKSLDKPISMNFKQFLINKNFTQKQAEANLEEPPAATSPDLPVGNNSANHGQDQTLTFKASG